jgi:3-oxoacyl-[acyl-carrier protein] reductase
MNTILPLSGKVALITGGSRGLGAATAQALAAAGADIAISFVASADKAQAVVRSLEEKGVRAAAFKADQGDPAQSEVLIRSVVERFGELHILVNNAAVSYYGTIDSPEIDNAAMDRQWAINVTGVVANIRAAVKVMSPGGRIISIGSGIATRAGIPGVADYAGTKAAIVGYSKGAARDLAARGITVNVIQAGLMDTDMAAPFKEAAPVMFSTLAIQRYGQLEEIAAGVVFLASPAASYITGAVIDIEGGYSA